MKPPTKIGTAFFGAMIAIPLALAGMSLASRPAVAGPSDCDAVVGNVVSNCGFEGGTYSSTIGGNTNNSVPNGWNSNAGYDLEPPYNFVTNATSHVYSGNVALSIGNADSQPAPALTQTIADVSGASYSGSLFVLYGGAGTSDTLPFFDVQINGANVLALNNTAAGLFTQYDFSFTGSGSDTLKLSGNTDPSEWYVDDIVITDPPPVPAPSLDSGPSSFAVLGGALGLFLFGRRINRRGGRA